MNSNFSVVILSYNHPEITARAVNSVLSLISGPAILLIHNGSLKQHQNFLIKTFPEISHLVLPLNQGFSGGANAGLRAAFSKSSWVLFLTNDCQLREFQVPASSPALLTPLIWARREGQVDSIGGDFKLPQAQLSHCRELRDFQNSSNPYAPGTAFWLHRDIFEKTQGFDESLGTYWEDVDFSMRVRKQGFLIAADLNTKIIHGIGKTCHRDTHYTTYLYQRNRKRIALKYSPKKGFSRLQTLYYLVRSWITLARKNIQKRNWAKLQLLLKAIWD